MNENKLCVKNKTCHFSCKDCITHSFASCLLCAENRILTKLSVDSNIGTCECPSNTSDFNEPECINSNTEKNI